MAIQPAYHHIRREGLHREAHARQQETLPQKPRTKARGNLDWKRHSYRSTHNTDRRVWENTSQERFYDYLENNKSTEIYYCIRLLKVTSMVGEYDNSKKKRDKDMTIIPPQMYELRSPAKPPLRQQPGTLQQEWHYRPPDKPPLEQTQKVPNSPTLPKPPITVQPTIQSPPGLQQPPHCQPEPTTAPQQPILPLQQ
eukprot:2108650-Amphidinium_carterae.1